MGRNRLSSTARSPGFHGTAASRGARWNWVKKCCLVDAPWYHVRVGHVEGWMSGVYVAFPRTREFVRSRGYIPLPVGRANQTVTLRTAMSDQSEAVCEVAQDTLMHVLNEPVNGWVHVMIPQGELSWQMDSDGTSGYLREEEITQGWSVKEMAAR